MAQTKKTLEISSALQWKAFAHPLRLGILDKLREADRTNEELSRLLGVESGKLYFHTRQLVRAGMIEPAGTRQKGPITEKLYRLAAASFIAGPPKTDGPSPPFADMLAAAMSMYQAAWRQDPKQMDLHLGYSLTIKAPNHRVREVAEQLVDVLRRFADEACDDPGSRTVSTTLLMYTMSSLDETKEEDEVKTKADEGGK